MRKWDEFSLCSPDSKSNAFLELVSNCTNIKYTQKKVFSTPGLELEIKINKAKIIQKIVMVSKN